MPVREERGRVLVQLTTHVAWLPVNEIVEWQNLWCVCRYKSSCVASSLFRMLISSLGHPLEMNLIGDLFAVRGNKKKRPIIPRTWSHSLLARDASVLTPKLWLPLTKSPHHTNLRYQLNRMSHSGRKERTIIAHSLLTYSKIVVKRFCENCGQQICPNGPSRLEDDR